MLLVHSRFALVVILSLLLVTSINCTTMPAQTPSPPVPSPTPITPTPPISMPPGPTAPPEESTPPAPPSSTVPITLHTKQTLQAAWILGLPGEVKPGGTPVEVVNFKTPQLEMGQISIILKTTTDVTSKLRDLSFTKLTLPRLSLVVRMDAKTESDYAYHMAEARVVSVKPLEGEQGAVAVNISFNKIELVAGVSMQPGPPSGAPKVQATGLNSAWIYGSFMDGSTGGMQVEIVDFTAPSFNGKLTVTFGESALDVVRLLLTRMPLRELILVLPDRASQRYVEFKLWEARATAVAGSNGQQVVFESDTIECLTE